MLPDWGTLLAILLSSDKTQLTNFSGGKQAYPCYLSLGNIAKSARSLAYLHAWQLIAYWPILTDEMLAKAGVMSKKTDDYTHLKSEILHGCVSVVLSQLKEHAHR